VEFKMDEPGKAEKFQAALEWAAAMRRNCLLWPSYYVFPPSAVASSQGPDYTEDQKAVSDDIANHLCVSQTLHPDSSLDVSDFRALRRELMLFASRAFILYESSPNEPEDAYVSYYDRDRWYYISNDDGISKMNLLLLSQFLTMQAEPSRTQTTPVSLSLQ
jgi:hypothetical protein